MAKLENLPYVDARRQQIALSACDPLRTEKLMREGSTTTWEQVANVLACSLDQVHLSVSGSSVYDYDKKEWVLGVTEPNEIHRLSLTAAQQEAKYRQQGDKKKR